ncbi:MAG: 4-hydroxy-tetrahydrodipicolinate reductase [Proteobacteria bacterium]|nr:4-hydroxy-tetrahydrodipicolinate reductase [Pseudomonadota bacterium]
MTGSVASGSPLRLAVAGASGRMGRMIIEAILETTDVALVGALDVAGSPACGQDAGAALGRALGVAIASDPAAALRDAQVLIDFTRPAGTLAHLEACRRLGVAIVIGTTGFDAAQKAEIGAHARHLPIMLAPNMSVGMNVVFGLLEVAARGLREGYDIEIIETHHRHKVDAPSGTALRMGEVIAAALGRDLAACAVYAREGVTGERDPATIGFSAIRGGDVIGDHTVLFAGTGERIEITHRSSSRTTYAHGALRAARFVAGRAPGLYDMKDVLGLT